MQFRYHFSHARWRRLLASSISSAPKLAQILFKTTCFLLVLSLGLAHLVPEHHHTTCFESLELHHQLEPISHAIENPQEALTESEEIRVQTPDVHRGIRRTFLLTEDFSSGL